ncbi:hypothetical protein ACSMXN_00970 [Jatrophihabitans sp. DSM 45814]
MATAIPNPKTIAAPAYAAVGAADLLVQRVAARLEELPSEALVGLIKVQDEAGTRVSALRSMLDDRLSAARQLRSTDVQSIAREKSAAYLDAAKAVYDSLATRGEAKFDALRDEFGSDPRIVRLIAEVGVAADGVEAKVRPVVGSVESKVRPIVGNVESKVRPIVGGVVEGVLGTVKAPTTRSAVKESAATQAPASKPPAKKAPAKKAPVAKADADADNAASSTAPAKRAPAKRTAAGKAPAGDTSTE